MKHSNKSRSTVTELILSKITKIGKYEDFYVCRFADDIAVFLVVLLNIDDRHKRTLVFPRIMAIRNDEGVKIRGRITAREYLYYWTDISLTYYRSA